MYNFTQHDVGLTVDKIVQIFTECSKLSHFLHPLVTHKIISVSKLHALEMLFPDSSCFPPAINRIEHIFKSRRLQIASESEYQTYLKQTFIGDLGRPPVASPVSVGQGGQLNVCSTTTPPVFAFAPAISWLFGG